MYPQPAWSGGWRVSYRETSTSFSMTNVNGKGLSAADRVKLYQKLAGNNPVHMLHPAADSWTMLNDFWFDAKENEFNRAGVVPQFTPDGAMPTAVKYNPNASYFDSADNYRVGFFGGVRARSSLRRPNRTSLRRRNRTLHRQAKYAGPGRVTSEGSRPAWRSLAG